MLTPFHFQPRGFSVTQRGRKKGQATTYTHEVVGTIRIRVNAGSNTTATAKAQAHAAVLNDHHKYLTVHIESSSVKEISKK